MRRPHSMLQPAIAVAAMAILLTAIQEGGPGLASFTSASAEWWLYGPPTGSYTDLSSNQQVQSLVMHVSGHDGGYDYPVHYTDGGSGFSPSTGSDGHLIIEVPRRGQESGWSGKLQMIGPAVRVGWRTCGSEIDHHTREL